MDIAVRYHSRGGNTKKVAEAIANAAGVKAEACTAPVTRPVDLLFLGGSVYGFGLDDATKDFIAGLTPSNVKAVALFSTSAMAKTGNRDMEKLLEGRGIPVLGQGFYCRGAFAVMHRGRPSPEDLSDAAKFAMEAMTERGH